MLDDFGLDRWVELVVAARDSWSAARGIYRRNAYLFERGADGSVSYGWLAE